MLIAHPSPRYQVRNCILIERPSVDWVKLEQLLRGSKIRFEYFGLPPNFGSDPPAVQNKIKAVPTGIVYLGGKEGKEGKEIGRIADNAWTSPETTLAAILSGKAPPAG